MLTCSRGKRRLPTETGSAVLRRCHKPSVPTATAVGRNPVPTIAAATSTGRRDRKHTGAALSAMAQATLPIPAARATEAGEKTDSVFSRAQGEGTSDLERRGRFPRHEDPQPVRTAQAMLELVDRCPVLIGMEPWTSSGGPDREAPVRHVADICSLADHSRIVRRPTRTHTLVY